MILHNFLHCFFICHFFKWNPRPADWPGLGNLSGLKSTAGGGVSAFHFRVQKLTFSKLVQKNRKICVQPVCFHRAARRAADRQHSLFSPNADCRCWMGRSEWKSAGSSKNPYRGRRKRSGRVVLLRYPSGSPLFSGSADRRNAVPTEGNSFSD